MCDIYVQMAYHPWPIFIELWYAKLHLGFMAKNFLKTFACGEEELIFIFLKNITANDDVGPQTES